MKLTFDQIRSIVKGAVDVRENADGTVWLHRFTDAQKAPYRENEPEHYLPAEYAANITLDFYTDAASAVVTLSGRKREKCTTVTVDLLVDGVPTQSVSHLFITEPLNDEVSYGCKTFRFDLPGKECRVTLQMPYMDTCDSVTLELSDGATLRPYTHSKRLVAFGDSITHGSTSARPAYSYISLLGRMLDAEVYNFGIGGERFETWKIVPGTYPQCDLVTVAYGTNDFGHKICSKALFSQRMPAFLKALAEEFPNVPVFVLLPLWRADEEVPKNDIPNLQFVRDAITQEAAKYANMTVIDCQDFIPHELKLYADARLHPNDKGMAFYATALYEAISETL